MHRSISWHFVVLESLGYDESSSMVVGLPEWVDRSEAFLGLKSVLNSYLASISRICSDSGQKVSPDYKIRDDQVQASSGKHSTAHIRVLALVRPQFTEEDCDAHQYGLYQEQ